MAWESTLYTTLSFNRKTYNNKWEVEDDIDELTQSINRCKKELRDLAMMTEPEKMLKSDGDDEYITPYDLIDSKLNEIFEILFDDFAEREKLYKLNEDWDKCHDKKSGLAIEPPNGIHYDDAFFDGDFVKTTNNPNPNEHIWGNISNSNDEDQQWCKSKEEQSEINKYNPSETTCYYNSDNDDCGD